MKVQKLLKCIIRLHLLQDETSEAEKVLHQESDWLDDDLLLRMKGELKLALKDYREAFNNLNLMKSSSINVFVQKCECYKNLQREQKAVEKI